MGSDRIAADKDLLICEDQHLAPQQIKTLTVSTESPRPEPWQARQCHYQRPGGILAAGTVAAPRPNISGAVSGARALECPLMNESIENCLNIVDVEATCWPGAPPPGQTSEIIEIGVCVVDADDWRRVQRRRILVRPRRSQVSAFCTELTGLTQDEVDGGVEFAQACALLRDELHGGRRTWASWGEYDRRQFERQCAAGDVEYPFGSNHINVKERFATAFGLRRGVGMGRALTHAGLPLEGRHHRGDDDAWNIAAIVIELARLGQPIIG